MNIETFVSVVSVVGGCIAILASDIFKKIKLVIQDSNKDKEFIISNVGTAMVTEMKIIISDIGKMTDVYLTDVINGKRVTSKNGTTVIFSGNLSPKESVTIPYNYAFGTITIEILYKGTPLYNIFHRREVKSYWKKFYSFPLKVIFLNG